MENDESAGSGSGSGRVSGAAISEQSIRECILRVPGAREQIVETAFRSLGAEKFYYSKEKKEMVHEPDYATQIKAVQWLAAYSDGLPVQTNINVNADAMKGQKALTVEEMLAENPALVDELERKLIRAREKRKTLAIDAEIK